MKVVDLGEFGVIDLLTEMVTTGRTGPDNAAPHGFRLLVDAGDDTAAWSCRESTELFTTDTVVEGVHFTRTTTPWYDLGWKLMAANVSDVAAMGGLPLYALVTLGLPPETEVDDLESMFRGMVDMGNRYGVAVVGGDVVRSPTVFVTVGLTGVCDGTPTLRSGAMPGDQVAVTGYLGSSAGGLEIMLKGLPVHGDAAEHLKTAHRRPEPCVPQGRILSSHGVRAAMDISDGLLDDLSKLCKASGLAATVEAGALPVHAALKEVFPKEYREMALGGGEDYQLLFTAPPDLMDRVLPLLEPPACVVGQMVAGEAGRVVVVDPETGAERSPGRLGWDHFG